MQSRKPLAVCDVSNFLKLNMQNTLHPSSFSQPPCVYRGSEGDGCYFTLHHPSSKKDLSLKASIIEDRNGS